MSSSSPSSSISHNHVWFDVTRDDPIFLKLLGEYDDHRPLELEMVDLPDIHDDLADPTALAVAAVRAAEISGTSSSTTTTVINYKAKLQQFGSRVYGSEPFYLLLDEQGPSHARVFESMVKHDANEAIFAQATGTTKKASEMEAAKRAWEKLVATSLSFDNNKNNNNVCAQERAAMAQQLTLSFRATATHLPFPVRFQLERALFSFPKLRIKKWLRNEPESKRAAEKLSVQAAARKLILVYMQIVLPPLLSLPWTRQGRTLPELFAGEIWESLQKVERATLMGTRIDFWEQNVHSAMERAQRSLAHAERVCDATESQLDDYGSNHDLQIVKQRSIWPLAEYRCRIRVHTSLVQEEHHSSAARRQTARFVNKFISAQLEPSDYEVVNKDISKNSFVPPNTRRAVREMGWLVRFRFLVLSSVKFDPLFDPLIADWLAGKPRICNREYVYLFDKGTGRPNVWLYSPPPPGASFMLSREDLLSSLGCFDTVPKTKLGDRISLAFTQTKPIVQLSLDRIVAIEEIVHDNYTFSDGAGVFGMDIALIVQDVFKLREVPGAIQVRMGGIKGMLTLKKDFPPDKVGIRPSMVKFRSSHMILEVKTVARANDSRDNKLFNQILLIMHHLKIPNRVFLDLQAMACAEMASEFDRAGFDRITAGKNIAEAYNYVNKVVGRGWKESGEPFSPAEFSSLKDTMLKARTRVNLRTNVTLMRGVPDEHGVLGAGEVLVGNGAVQGSVLICRSPCNMPGDIQRAYAIQGRQTEPFIYLKAVLVFSVNGTRPLADMLAGGDYDGDEYYVIHEERLCGMFTEAKASDFGSRKESIQSKIDVGHCFTVPITVSAPDIADQLEVFAKFMALGDIVARSSEAWLRVADEQGPRHADALKMAGLCQRALDARKLALQFEPEELNAMKTILNRYKAPDWHSGGRLVRESTSILGIMSRKWQDWIEQLGETMKRRHRSLRNEIVPEDEIDQIDTETVASIESEICVVCFAKANQQCLGCVSVWYCSDSCERTHGFQAGHLKLSKDTRGTGAIKSPEGRNNFASEGPNPANFAIETLIDVVFGRMKTECSETPLDYRVIHHSDLDELANMVALEFSKSISDALKDVDVSRAYKDTPNVFDVFLMDSSIYEQGGKLAVYVPLSDYGRDLVWRDREGNCLSMDEVPYKRRVASLSGPARVLESLLCKPAVGSLMHNAMQREMIFDVGDAPDLLLDPSIADRLNESQRKVVASVAGPTFHSGFLAVQGPPGTGKTHTIVGILAAVERGAIVTAPSNAAVANLVLTLLSTNRYTVRDLVVFGENCDESVKFLNPVNRRNRYDSFLRNYLATHDEADKLKKLNAIATWLHLGNDKSSLPEVAALCESDCAPLAFARFVFCTLNTAGSRALRKAAQARFNLLILDEAGQCTEAEFYIATTFPGVKRIVLVGDPMQLPATVVSQTCRDAGFGESFLAHLMRYHGERVHLLNTQYRMHPKILQFSNESFYSKRVLSHVTLIGRQPEVHSPILFIDVSGMTLEERVRTSWKNEYEAAVIKSILRNDEDIRRVLETNTSARVIVVSPYAAQVDFLRKALKKIDSVLQKDVATVDSFQGQEGDIVIVSTVRTSSTDFFDTCRLNVALTRAKSLLRVVGDIELCKSARAEGTALRDLACFAEKNRIVKAADIDAAWRRPDWTATTRWKPTMTSKFHHCLKTMTSFNQNVAFNTLLAVVTPDLRKLAENPVEKGPPRWQKSSLLGYSKELQIVWVGKEYEWSGGSKSEAHFVGVVEGHFVGSPKECLDFTQQNRIPILAHNVRRDLAGIVQSIDGIVTLPTKLDYSWLITNDLQDAIFDDILDVLPDGLFVLDQHQERIITLKPPLLLESRSGTGKTNCLFCHALSYARRTTDAMSGASKPICFVTVSPRLSQNLQKRYSEVEKIERIKLPPIAFFSFRELLDNLLRMHAISDFETSSVCNFFEYANSRRSHKKMEVEMSLADNEIGGCILGSLDAALQGDPLSRQQYLQEKRSNVPNNSEEGRSNRNLIYDEFEKYQLFKSETGKKLYDINDIVLRLLESVRNGTLSEIFQSAYVDEVQDFSYASLFLICSVAGRAEGKWVAVGDSAQMIGDGTSFTFDGMKQTLRAVREGIALRKVQHLTRNYRMSKGVLEVGNAILGLLKKHFPHAIEYAPPEIAMKDLGLPVVLLDWDKATQSKVSFGVNQAVIYATPNDGVAETISSWIGDHPFILSSLEAKGLEFEDVVVHAFDYPRKAWNLESKSFESLRLLKELYVAVTRAQQRVVILTKGGATGMTGFFEQLNCNLETVDPSAILVEFNKQTSPEQWFKRGSVLFEEEKYDLAAGCFKAANQFGWSGWSWGRYLLVLGRQEDARDSFRTAARMFFDVFEFRSCLDVMKDIARFPDWRDVDNELLDAALEKEPDYLPRTTTIKFALFRERWNVINLSDLMDSSASGLFDPFREKLELREMITHCSDFERQSIEKTLPNVVGDYYLAQQNLREATRLFLRGRDFTEAIKASDRAVETAGHEEILDIADYWHQDHDARWKIADSINKNKISLLVKLLESPESASAEFAAQCMRRLGAEIVKLAVDHAGCGIEELHRFDRLVFRKEILEALTSRYQSNPSDVVDWYLARVDETHAASFAEENLNKWSDEQLLTKIMPLLKLKQFSIRSAKLVTELERRNLLLEATKTCLVKDYWDLSFAELVSNRVLQSIESASQNADQLVRMWDARRNDARVKSWLTQKPDSSSIRLLLLLFRDPKEIGSKFGKTCLAHFGEMVVRKAVTAIASISSEEDSDSILRLFDETLAPEKPRKPASRSEGRSPPRADGPPANTDSGSKFQVGDRVVTFGLTTVQGRALNGKCGRVALPEKDGRFGVQLDGRTHKISLISGENLKREADDVGDDSSSDGSNATPPLVSRFLGTANGGTQEATQSPRQEGLNSSGRNAPAQSYPGFDDNSVGSSDSMPKRGQGRKLGDSSSEDGSMPSLIEGQHAGGSSSSSEAKRPDSGFRPRSQSGNNNSSSSSGDDGPPRLTQRQNVGLESDEDFSSLPQLVERDLVESSGDEAFARGRVPPLGNNNSDESLDESLQRGAVPSSMHPGLHQASERGSTERHEQRAARRQKSRNKKGKKKK